MLEGKESKAENKFVRLETSKKWGEAGKGKEANGKESSTKKDRDEKRGML